MSNFSLKTCLNQYFIIPLCANNNNVLDKNMKKLDIKRALREHNMTQVELCKRTGLLTQNMSPIINGNPTISKLFQVAEGIGCDITELFYPDPEEEAEAQERRDREMEQEIEKGLESAKDSKMTLEQTLRDLTRRAYPSITEEEVKEWVEAITKKKGIVKFNMTPRGKRGLADMAKLEEARKKHEGETLNADIRGALPEGFICKDVRFISEAPGERAYIVHENGLVTENQQTGVMIPASNMMQAETFCPHCGTRVKLGVVMIQESK